MVTGWLSGAARRCTTLRAVNAHPPAPLCGLASEAARVLKALTRTRFALATVPTPSESLSIPYTRQGARILGELGDDRTRFTDARALKAYAGSAPVTRASGKNRAVFTRRVKNQRLASAGHQWAFNTLAASPAPKPTTSAAANTETGTTPPYATCSTANSASCTA
jgi:hypothetical protein